LVIGVIFYSGMMSALMVFFGHHLTSVIEHTNQSEAEFRAAVDAFRENGENGGAKLDVAAGRDTLLLRLQAVLLWWREFCWQLIRTTLVSHEFSVRAGRRMALVRSQILKRHDVTRRTYTSGSRLCHGAGRVQLARRQLSAIGRLALIGPTCRDLAHCH
jgi:ABC-type uncharacterized transport system fused permease/ATPase subunit